MNSTVSETEIPRKSLFKVSEVCELSGIRPYVLRFWESEFDIIAPIIGENGQKLYERKDIESIELIKKLLFEDKFTIEKAKFFITENKTVLKSDAAEFDENKDKDEDEKSRKITETSVNQKKEHFYLKRSLTDSEWQKIILAKAKLSSLISFCNQITISKELR